MNDTIEKLGNFCDQRSANEKSYVLVPPPGESLRISLERDFVYTADALKGMNEWMHLI